MRPFTHHTHSCPLCRVARRTATKNRHVCRFRASFWMVPQVCCMVLSSASTVRRQVFLGLHLLRFPSGVQWRAVLVILSCSLLMTCPIHLHRLPMMMVSMLSWLQRASSCWLEMVSGQKIRRILLRFGVWKTDSLVMSLSVILQHSKPIVGGHHTALVDLQIFSAWSLCCSERTSTPCWVFWRRVWPCWDSSWCYSLLFHHALLCCPCKWTLQLLAGLLRSLKLV